MKIKIDWVSLQIEVNARHDGAYIDAMLAAAAAYKQLIDIGWPDDPKVSFEGDFCESANAAR